MAARKSLTAFIGTASVRRDRSALLAAEGGGRLDRKDLLLIALVFISTLLLRTYRLEVPPDTMVVVTLSALPADYALHLRLADGSVQAEAGQPGTADKTARLDGLAPGRYFVSVVSPRGAANADLPYLLRVSYRPTLVLTTPAPPGGGPCFRGTCCRAP